MAELGEQLSEREQDVLEQLVQGASNKVIAANLFISPNTVKVHLRNINTKLGASSRTEASRIALEQGLVTLPGMEPAETAPENGEPPSAEPAPVSEPDADQAQSSTASAEPIPQEKSTASTNNVWLIAAVAVLVLALLGIGGWFLFNQQGEDGEVSADSFEPAQVEESRWFTSRKLPESLAGASAVTVGSDIYVIGGRQSDGAVNDEVHVYNTAEHEWRAVAINPEPTQNGSAIFLVASDGIFSVGGELPNEALTDRVSVYNPAENSWGQAASLPKPLSGGLLLSDGGAQIYYLGGQDADGAVSDAFVYDLTTDQWKSLPAMPDARTASTGGLVLGSIYVIGGQDSAGNPTADCFKFEISAGQWESCTGMSNSRVSASSAVIFNEIYVVGGETGADFGELYNPESDTWEQIDQPMVEELDSHDWTNSAVSTVDSNKMYVLGGEFNGTLSTDAYFYSPLPYQSFIPSATNE